MRRWHEDRGLMLRRWRQEIALHESDKYSYSSLAPIPPIYAEGNCHCYKGMGFLRKSTPYGCGKPRCIMCHYSKILYKKKRRVKHNKLAIEENERGWGMV